MLKRIALCTLAATATLTAPSVFAGDHGRYYRSDDGDYDYAKVTHVEPIVRRVRVETPVRECWQETRTEEPRYDNNPDVAARTLLGGIIGGVIGHQIGDGNGKRIATAAGAVIGSAVGHNSAVRRQGGAYSEPREYSVERCDVRRRTTYEERVEGYDVEYRYNGRTYHTRMPYDPGDRVQIRVAVTPTYER